LRGRLSFGSAGSGGNASDEMPFAEPELIKLRECYSYFVVVFSNLDGKRASKASSDAADISFRLQKLPLNARRPSCAITSKFPQRCDSIACRVLATFTNNKPRPDPDKSSSGLGVRASSFDHEVAHWPNADLSEVYSRTGSFRGTFDPLGAGLASIGESNVARGYINPRTLPRQCRYRSLSPRRSVSCKRDIQCRIHCTTGWHLRLPRYRRNSPASHTKGQL
jgi:hypothetical protein